MLWNYGNMVAKQDAQAFFYDSHSYICPEQTSSLLQERLLLTVWVVRWLKLWAQLHETLAQGSSTVLIYPAAYRSPLSSLTFSSAAEVCVRIMLFSSNFTSEAMLLT